MYVDNIVNYFLFDLTPSLFKVREFSAYQYIWWSRSCVIEDSGPVVDSFATLFQMIITSIIIIDVTVECLSF